MKTCKNCYWFGQCVGEGNRCEYYDPVIGSENVVLREYLQALKEREEDYKQLIIEQQDIREDEF